MIKLSCHSKTSGVALNHADKITTVNFGGSEEQFCPATISHATVGDDRNSIGRQTSGAGSWILRW